MAIVAGGTAAAVVVGTLYVTIVLPRGTEWQEAFLDAQDIAIHEFMRHGVSPERLLAVGAHRRDCFPTQSEWIWARFRQSAAQVTPESREDYLRCLKDAADEATKVRGWRPPGPEI